MRSRAHSTSSPTRTKMARRLPANGYASSTPRRSCAQQSTRGRPPVRKDFADVFADQGEAAREVLEHLRQRAVDALHLELSEAPKGSNNLGAYRVAKERILPLLLKLEDEGERDAALHDVADKFKLSIKPLRKVLAALQLHADEPQEAPPETVDNTPKPDTERYERAMGLLK